MTQPIQADAFLESYQTMFNASKHTLKAYRFDLQDFCSYIQGKASSALVDKQMLCTYLLHLREERTLKETTIKRRIACLRLYFRWANEKEFIATNPFDQFNERIRLPKRLPRALDKDDISLLKRAIFNNLGVGSLEDMIPKVAIALLITTGIRVGELVDIDTQSIDITNGSIKITGKGNRQRMVYILDYQLQRALKDYIRIREAVIPSVSKKLLINESGKSFSTDKIRHILLSFSESAGITRRITPHMLRHTAATLWLEAGLDIRYVQKLLGHHSISTTEIYTHVSDNSLKQALQRAMMSGIRV